VDIANRALSRVGDNRIQALTDNTAAARAVNAAWTIIRDEVLAAHPWNCVMKRAQLPALATAPSFGYDEQYQQPADCLRVVEVLVGNIPTNLAWVIEGQLILSDDAAPLNVRYIARVTDANQYDPMLVSALAARLASEIVEELTQSNTKKEALFQEYLELLRRARGVDGMEQSSMDLAEDPWILARN
jgi:hypothetical protein